MNTSKDLLLEYRELLHNGYIIKTVNDRLSNNKYHTAHISLSNKFINKKIRIELVK
jgi:hypothetical protein